MPNGGLIQSNLPAGQPRRCLDPNHVLRCWSFGQVDVGLELGRAGPTLIRPLIIRPAGLELFGEVGRKRGKSFIQDIRSE